MSHHQSTITRQQSGDTHADLPGRAPVFRPPGITTAPAVPAEPPPRLVYVIVAPATRAAPGWPAILADLSARVRGARLRTFHDVFGAGTEVYRREREKRLGEFSGAVVVPMERDGRMLAGPAALSEARYFTRRGCPVLVRLPGDGRLLPWGGIVVRGVPGTSWSHAAAELLPCGGGA